MTKRPFETHVETRLMGNSAPYGLPTRMTASRTARSHRPLGPVGGWEGVGVWSILSITHYIFSPASKWPSALGEPSFSWNSGGGGKKKINNTIMTRSPWSSHNDRWCIEHKWAVFIFFKILLTFKTFLFFLLWEAEAARTSNSCIHSGIQWRNKGEKSRY